MNKTILSATMLFLALNAHYSQAQTTTEGQKSNSIQEVEYAKSNHLSYLEKYALVTRDMANSLPKRKLSDGRGYRTEFRSKESIVIDGVTYERGILGYVNYKNLGSRLGITYTNKESASIIVLYDGLVFFEDSLLGKNIPKNIPNKEDGVMDYIIYLTDVSLWDQGSLWSLYQYYGDDIAKVFEDDLKPISELNTFKNPEKYVEALLDQYIKEHKLL